MVDLILGVIYCSTWFLFLLAVSKGLKHPWNHGNWDTFHKPNLHTNFTHTNFTPGTRPSEGKPKTNKACRITCAIARYHSYCTCVCVGACCYIILPCEFNYSGTPLKGHLWIKHTSLIRTLDQSQLHTNMYYLPLDMRTPPYNQDTFYWPKGVRIREVPLWYQMYHGKTALHALT